MAQKFWKYTNIAGSEYIVSLYHGADTGHIVLYSGQEIIKIDFSVYSDKKYFFMLDEDLIELQIIFEDNKVRYVLINENTKKEIPVFKNTNHRLPEKVTWVVLIILGLLFVLFIRYFLMK